MTTTTADEETLQDEFGPDDHDQDNSFEFSSSYGSYFDSNYDDTYASGIHSQHRSITVDENTPILKKRENYRRKSTINSSKHYISYTASLLTNATHSISKLTTSNYFGFSSAAFATAHHKDVEVSRTLSLADIISTDRFTPSVITFFQILSMLTGLSIFVLPSLVARCGLWVLIHICVISFVTWYCSYLVHLCQYQVSRNGIRKRVYNNYIELGKATIKWHGDEIMKVLVATSICTDIYSLIFCAQISTDLLSQYIKLDNKVWMLIWVSLVFPLFFIRKMSVLAWFGFFALALYVIGLVCASLLLIIHHDQWTWQNLNPHFDLPYFFVGFGVIMNTYNMHLAIPAIEGSMKIPKHYQRVNAPSWIVNTIIKVFVAVTGAATFGLLTKGSVLTNLASFGVYAAVVNVTIGLYMYTQYPTSMFVVFEMMDTYILPKFKLFKAGEKSETIWLIMSRLLVSVFIAFVAVSLPNFELLTGFIGNIRGTFTCITLPIYFYLKIHKRRISMCSKIFHTFIIVIATAMSLVGAGFSIYGMF